jgi:hypothetical protein
MLGKIGQVDICCYYHMRANGNPSAGLGKIRGRRCRRLRKPLAASRVRRLRRCEAASGLGTRLLRSCVSLLRLLISNIQCCRPIVSRRAGGLPSTRSNFAIPGTHRCETRRRQRPCADCGTIGKAARVRDRCIASAVILVSVLAP